MKVNIAEIEALFDEHGITPTNISVRSGMVFVKFSTVKGLLVAREVLGNAMLNGFLKGHTLLNTRDVALNKTLEIGFDE